MTKEVEIFFDETKTITKTILKRELTRAFYDLTSVKMDWKLKVTNFNLGTIKSGKMSEQLSEQLSIDVFVENLQTTLRILYYYGTYCDLSEGIETEKEFLFATSFSEINSAAGNFFLTAAGAVALARIYGSDILEPEGQWTGNYRSSPNVFIDKTALKNGENPSESAVQLAERFYINSGRSSVSFPAEETTIAREPSFSAFLGSMLRAFFQTPK